MILYKSLDFLDAKTVYALAHGEYGDHERIAVCATREEAEWGRKCLCAVSATTGNYPLQDEKRGSAQAYARLNNLDGLLEIVATHWHAKERYDKYMDDMVIEEIPMFSRKELEEERDRLAEGLRGGLRVSPHALSPELSLLTVCPLCRQYPCTNDCPKAEAERMGKS